MGMQVRVGGARVVVVEGSGDNSAHGHLCHRAVGAFRPGPSRRDVALDDGEHVADGFVVGGRDQRLGTGVGDRP
jgi:hypothetical protein